jgi:ribosomal protein S18 acetylase RimI-like enzyme
MQNQGIGSSVLTDLLASTKPVRLHVFALNVRARALYERLGFVITEENDGRIDMRFPTASTDE